MLTDFVTYTQRKGIDIKDNFDLVLRLLLSSVLVFEVLKQVNQKN
jgi:magnesium transporter